MYRRIATKLAEVDAIREVNAEANNRQERTSPIRRLFLPGIAGRRCCLAHSHAVERPPNKPVTAWTTESSVSYCHGFLHSNCDCLGGRLDDDWHSNRIDSSPCKNPSSILVAADPCRSASGSSRAVRHLSLLESRNADRRNFYSHVILLGLRQPDFNRRFRRALHADASMHAKQRSNKIIHFSDSRGVTPLISSAPMPAWISFTAAVRNIPYWYVPSCRVCLPVPGSHDIHSPALP
jgi:hypothetical protein